MEAALQKGPYKLMTVTHVDTSTGVLTDTPAGGAGAKTTRYRGRRRLLGSRRRTALDDWGVDAARPHHKQWRSARAGAVATASGSFPEAEAARKTITPIGPTGCRDAGV